MTRGAYQLLLVLSAFLAILGAGCAGGDAVSLEDVADAATATGKYPGVRIAMTMTTRVPGLEASMTTSATGVVNTRAHRGYMKIDMTDLRRVAMAGVPGAAKRLGPPAAWRGEQVVDYSDGRLVTYMRLPFMSRAVQTSKPWIKMDLQELGEQSGIDFQQFTQLGNGNPTQAVDFLRAASGRIESKGHEEVRGVDTARYHVLIDLEKYPSLVPSSERENMRKSIDRLIELTGVKTVPADVWISDDDLVRKMHYVYAMRVLDKRTGRRVPREMGLTMELFDFGASTDVALPPASKVFDLAELAGRTD